VRRIRIVTKKAKNNNNLDRGFPYGGTGPPEWPTVVLNRQSGHAASLSRQVGHFLTSTTCYTGQPWHGIAKGAKCAPEPPTRPYLPNQWPVYIPAIGQGDLSNQWPVHTGHWAGRPLRSMAGKYQSLGRETSPINGWYIPVIRRGDLPDQWPVHTRHWAGRPP
jgi:hypothetical protein